MSRKSRILELQKLQIRDMNGAVLLELMAIWLPVSVYLQFQLFFFFYFKLICFGMTAELAYSFKATEKSDVYSFGVVLLELATGLRPVEEEFGEGKDIVDYVLFKIQQDGRNLRNVLDKQGLSSNEEESMIKILKMGLLCTTKLPSLRPNMREVVRKLEDADPCVSNPLDRTGKITV